MTDAEHGDTLALSPLLAQIRPVLLAQETPVYLVGGAVRDALLGQVSYDLDFAVPAGAVQLAFRVADALHLPAYVLDRERDIGRVVLADSHTALDFAAMRGESLEADLRDRDFTMNAMALPAGETTAAALIDPTGGQADLAARRVQLTHPQAITDDPVRALRAIRMMLRFDCTLSPETEAAVRAAATQVTQTSPERVRDELLKLLMTDAPDAAVQHMAALGLLSEVLPEIAALAEVTQSPPHHEDVLGHTISVMHWLVRVEAAVVDGREATNPAVAEAQRALQPYRDQLANHLARRVDGGLSGRVLLRLAALFHDVGKPAVRRIDEDGRIRFFGHDQEGAKIVKRRLRRMNLSNEAVEHVQRVVSGHMRPLHLARAEKVTRRAIYRYFQATGRAGMDVALVSLADQLAKHGGVDAEAEWQDLLDVLDDLLHHFFFEYETVVAPRPVLDGGELMRELKLRPGPEIGRLLRTIQEAQAAGEVQTREEALELAQRERR